jgi:hypothetical protein
MKILSEGKSIWLERRSNLQNKKFIKSSNLKRHQKLSKFKSHRKLTNNSICKINAPQYIKYYAIKPQRKLLEKFFTSVELALDSGKKVFINLQSIDILFPCGLLLFLGHMQEWHKKYSEKISGNYPKNDLVEQMLQHVKIIQKLGLKERKIINHEDVTRWYCLQGSSADATPIEPFLIKLQNILGEEQQVSLGSCITEAMTNVGHHAYSNTSDRPWWMFATINKESILIAFYDKGDSIPGTLLKKAEVYDHLVGRSLIPRYGDKGLLAAALGGRSSTKLAYRGKGLPEMLSFTKNNIDSELGIYSRYGSFRYTDSQEVSGKLTNKINGTLVIWKIKFQG